MTDQPEQVSLYRYYRADGSTAFACTIEEDRDSPRGYRIVDRDPRVADDWFLDRLERHMRSPVECSYIEERPDGITVGGTMTLHPGEAGYFDAAARSVPCAWIGRWRAPRNRGHAPGDG
ncbi:MAG: hypothetical protein D6798_16240 [Deltaproteobacteria bacterium]|nr:MAG: hypothetical protein D6798_16240 [Deltaproteobacteria bacterium]